MWKLGVFRDPDSQVAHHPHLAGQSFVIPQEACSSVLFLGWREAAKMLGPFQNNHPTRSASSLSAAGMHPVNKMGLKMLQGRPGCPGQYQLFLRKVFYDYLYHQSKNIVHITHG